MRRSVGGTSVYRIMRISFFELHLQNNVYLACRENVVPFYMQ